MTGLEYKTQVVERPLCDPEDDILYDAQADDFHHFTVSDAAFLDLPNVSDEGKQVAMDHLGAALSDDESDESEGGYAD
jgi:hypothetical protein